MALLPEFYGWGHEELLPMGRDGIKGFNISGAGTLVEVLPEGAEKLSDAPPDFDVARSDTAKYLTDRGIPFEAKLRITQSVNVDWPESMMKVFEKDREKFDKGEPSEYNWGKTQPNRMKVPEGVEAVLELTNDAAIQLYNELAKSGHISEEKRDELISNTMTAQGAREDRLAREAAEAAVDIETPAFLRRARNIGGGISGEGGPAEGGGPSDGPPKSPGGGRNSGWRGGR